MTPFSKLLSALRGDETTTLSCHPHCSLGTYLFVDQNRKAVPVTQFVEVGPMLREMDVLARKAEQAPHPVLHQDFGLEQPAQVLP